MVKPLLDEGDGWPELPGEPASRRECGIAHERHLKLTRGIPYRLVRAGCRKKGRMMCDCGRTRVLKMIEAG